jgi:uncharacterized protein (DUF1501 family)
MTMTTPARHTRADSAHHARVAGTTPERRRLSFPGADIGLSRRRFMQLGAAGAGGLAMTPLLSHLEAFAAPALGPHDPILVLVELDGGNDGLNTVCPIGQSAYYAKRPNIAIPANQALRINSATGLHPQLDRIKFRYDSGKVAVIRGVGYNPPDFSHFSSMAYWMQGWGGTSLPYPTGWIGRWADGLPNAAKESLYQVVLDQSVPLHHVGVNNQASGLPLWVGGAFGMDRDDAWERRLYQTVANYAASGNSGLGAWGNEIAATGKQLVQITGKIGAAYTGEFPDDYFVRQMVLAARLININLGIRVITARIGGFDNHSGQGGVAGDHADLMKSLDDGINAFFQTISPTFKRQTLVMTFSEFGRRPEQNADNGTDHGTSGPVLLIGDLVKGGLYGTQPLVSDSQLVDYGNLKSFVDFRSVYATVLRKWMRADDREILGRRYELLDCITSAP